MGYQIYGYVQVKDRDEQKWKTACIYHKTPYKDELCPIVLWHGREVGQYLWQKGTYVTKDEAKEFMREMDYWDEEAEEAYKENGELLDVKAISLAYMKYLALTFEPEHNDYDYSGDEDRIKPGLEEMAKQVEMIVEFADYYGTLDEVRFIFHESY